MLPLTIPEAFAAVAARRPDHPFIVFGDAEISYAKAHDRIGRVAAGLARLGVARGDRVACYLGNCPEFLWTWFGVNALGATGAGGAPTGHVSLTGPIQSAGLRKPGSCSMWMNRPV